MLTPQFLTDKSRLQEIYDLRVEAWENSANKAHINRKNFPIGWFDKHDPNAHHWIIEDEGKIVAGSRICMLTDLAEIAEVDFSIFTLSSARPFAYFSRLVVHPQYRRKGFTHLMDKVRVDFLQSSEAAFALSCSAPQRRTSLEQAGFTELGMLQVRFSGDVFTNIAFIRHF
jgi:GNAT superfamily N-acetyltransferase